MSLDDNIKEALTGYLQRTRPFLDVAKVISWEEDTEHDGYCETCYYEYAVVRVNYIDTNDLPGHYTIGESFGELISAL